MTQRTRSTLILGACALLAIPLSVRWQRAKAELSFSVVDYVTGGIITNARVDISRRWTELPVEKIPFLTVNPRYHRHTSGSNGIFTINVRQLDWSTRIAVQAPSYADAILEQQRIPNERETEVYRIFYLGTNWLHSSPYEYVNRWKPFVIGLEPETGGSGRLGAVYKNPSQGSEEAAIKTVRDYIQNRGGKWSTPESTQFVNGHWEIRFGHRLGGQVQYDLSESGELLCIHAAE